MEYNWTPFERASIPMDRHSYISSTRAFLTVCNNWEIYIETTDRYNLYKRKIIDETILLDGVVINANYLRVFLFQITEEKGLELSSSRYLLTEKSLPKYVIDKLKRLPDELFIINRYK